MTEHRFRILWSDIGCPITPGRYLFQGRPVAVLQAHIEAAKNDPDTICKVICSQARAGGERYSITSVELPD